MTRVFGHFLSHTKRAAILEVVQEFHIRELPFVKSQPEDNHEVNYFTAISLINRGTLYFKLSLSISSRRIQSAWGIGRKRKKNRKAERTRRVLSGGINEIVLLRSRSARSAPRFFSPYASSPLQLAKKPFHRLVR